ncbi:alpha/beta hydrolase [Polymorphobacter arshaanensis]|uniref:Alpha/beta hydrolase n=1 Tax=Glacieibacterium arshaanense TaxID=2511025 RepID=A0A4Y9ESN9_9SPHN|nr:alpha/beta hydrolase-fold protein [Polymorphobacter arshaanensis]TFU05918.1 alpha/beta hydrolase [Polymorphobacter arshaanensis]
MMRMLLALMLLLAAPALAAPPASGTTIEIPEFASKFVKPRHVSIWLPPGYSAQGKPARVLYMHDGQNIFDGANAYGGNEWGVDEAVTKLLAEHKLPPMIVIGVWNTDKRYEEYFPQKLVQYLPPALQAKLDAATKGGLQGDAYLKFLVRELKPYIDRHYRTLSGPADTAVMGSSMGGLISIYAMAEYPRVFGQAAALSVHWPLVAPSDAANAAGDADAVAAAFTRYFATAKWAPGRNRLYIDHGDQGLDQYYRPYSARIEAEMPALGWSGDSFVSRTWPGATHNEVSWRKRLDVPLLFLFGER